MALPVEEDNPMEPEDYRRTTYEIAEAIALGWERQRARIEEAVAPMRA